MRAAGYLCLSQPQWQVLGTSKGPVAAAVPRRAAEWCSHRTVAKGESHVVPACLRPGPAMRSCDWAVSVRPSGQLCGVERPHPASLCPMPCGRPARRHPEVKTRRCVTGARRATRQPVSQHVRPRAQRGRVNSSCLHPPRLSLRNVMCRSWWLVRQMLPATHWQDG